MIHVKKLYVGNSNKTTETEIPIQGVRMNIKPIIDNIEFKNTLEYSYLIIYA